VRSKFEAIIQRGERHGAVWPSRPAA